jgi:hypothetical protein
MSRLLKAAKWDSFVHLLKVNRSLSIVLAFVLTVSATLAQAPLSDKQLYQRAEKENAAGKIDEAYASVKEARIKKNKPDKKYDELFRKTGDQLADREAGKGEAACNNDDLATCEAQLKKAKEFGTTANVTRLQSTFDQKLGAVRTRYNNASQLAATEPDLALSQLVELNRYRSHLPELPTQIDRVRSLAVNRHNEAGAQQIKEQKWDNAVMHFNRVLELSAGNEVAGTGLKDVARLREASRLHSEAKSLWDARKFQEALSKVDQSLAAAPDNAEYKETRQRIRSDWAKQLVSFIGEGLTGKLDDLDQTRTTYLNFEQLRSLDGADPNVSKFGSEPSVNFGANLLLKAAELEVVSDYSRIGTAAIMKVKAQQLLSSVRQEEAKTVRQEEVKDVFGYFNRRRRTQLLISVENLSSEGDGFVVPVKARTRNALESAELPDLAIRDLEEYRKTPDEDPVVKGLTADGKSSTGLLTVSINKYEVTRKIVNKLPKASEYRTGSEDVNNPEYARIKSELDAIRKDLADPKNKKKEVQAQLTRMLEDKQRELNGVPQVLHKDKVTRYDYEEITYNQQVHVEATLTLRDFHTKEVIASEVISSDPTLREMKDTEIRGVNPADVKGVRDQPPTMLTETQALKLAERQVLDQITSKAMTMLPKFTKRFYTEGRLAVEQGRLDDAVENFICHWGFFRGKLEKGELENLSGVVYARTGFDFQKDGRTLTGLGLASTVRP